MNRMNQGYGICSATASYKHHWIIAIKRCDKGHQWMRSRWKTQCVFGRTSVWWGLRSHPVIGTRPLSRVYITHPTSLGPGIRKHHETLWVADFPTLRGWHYNEITNISVYCLVLVCWSTFSEHVYSEHNAHEKAIFHLSTVRESCGRVDAALRSRAQRNDISSSSSHWFPPVWDK